MVGVVSDLKNEMRSKLQAGVSIDQVCRDYQITFLSLMNLMIQGEPIPHPSQKSKYGLYIDERDGKYLLRKNSVWYGSYKSVEDATKVKEWFYEHGWDKNKIDEACKNVGVERNG